MLSRPNSYLSKNIEWQGKIKEIDMQDEKVRLTFLTKSKKWYVLVDAKKFIPEND